MKLLALLIALMLSAPAPAQSGVWVLPQLGAVVTQQLTPDGIYAIHQGGTVSLTSFDGDTSYSRGTGQGPIGGNPVPTLTTEWTDKKGVTHTVTTPIISQSPTGLHKAKRLHQALVASLQDQYPPRPVS